MGGKLGWAGADARGACKSGALKLFPTQSDRANIDCAGCFNQMRPD